MKSTTFDFMKNSVLNEKLAIEKLFSIMEKSEYEKAIDYLMSSKLTITSACGSSGFTAKKFAHSLSCIECPAKFVAPSEAVHGGMGALKKGNALVIVSKGGKTDELIPLVSICKEKQANLILVTANPDSLLAKEADAVLCLPDVKESDRYNVMSTASFSATIAIFDALMMGLMEEKNYQLSDFALIHPGGAVGKRIN